MSPTRWRQGRRRSAQRECRTRFRSFNSLGTARRPRLSRVYEHHRSQCISGCRCKTSWSTLVEFLVNSRLNNCHKSSQKSTNRTDARRVASRQKNRFQFFNKRLALVLTSLAPVGSIRPIGVFRVKRYLSARQCAVNGHHEPGSAEEGRVVRTGVQKL